MGDTLIKLILYTVVLGLTVHLVTNPDVLTDYSDRMYVATISDAYRGTAQKMFQLYRKARQIERDYERHRYTKSTTRERLLDLYDQFERIVYILSQSSVNRYERDDLIAKARSFQNGINRWGVDHGF